MLQIPIVRGGGLLISGESNGRLPFNWRRRSCLPHLLLAGTGWVLRSASTRKGRLGRQGGPHEPSRNGPRIIIVRPPPLSRLVPPACATAYQPPNFHFRSGVMPTCERCEETSSRWQPSPWPIHPCPRPRLCEMRRRPRGDWLESLRSYPHDVPTLEVDRGLSALLSVCLSGHPSIHPFPFITILPPLPESRVQSLESPPGDRAVLRCVVMPLCPGPASVSILSLSLCVCW